MNKVFEYAFKEIQGSSGFSMDRDRDYDGQSHTDNGIRGKTKVSGLTMRDVADCMVMALMDCAQININSPIRDDIYKVNLEDIDFGAVMQNTTCYIEKMMGIYPNIKR